jgi:hypothetical protein
MAPAAGGSGRVTQTPSGYRNAYLIIRAQLFESFGKSGTSYWQKLVKCSERYLPVTVWELPGAFRNELDKPRVGVDKIPICRKGGPI